MDRAQDRRHRERNLKLARTEKRHGDESWYVLDSAASFMPGLTDMTITLVFRISATLTETVDLPRLQAALSAVAKRFPYYLVELRRGLFWYYLDPLDKEPRVSADSRYPCLNMQVRRRGRFLFRVRAYRSRVAMEFCHVLSDGTGAMAFLKALLAEYYRLGGVETPPTPDIFLPDQEPDPEESEDAFNRHVRKGVPYIQTAPKAFHFPALPLMPGQYRVTTGKAPLGASLALAKSYGCSLTELLVAIYMDALQEIFYGLPRPIRAGMNPIIAVEVPVNLRRIFPSKTLRNFSLYVLPSLDTRLGYYEFDEIVKRVHHYMQVEVSDKAISRQISRNVLSGRSLLVRALPLFLKNLAAHLVYKRMGEDTITGFISNLGPVSLPEPLASRVERFEFIPAPSRRCKTNANVLSWKDDLYISFGSLAATTEVERLFFSRLVRMGIPVSVESNM